MIIVKKNKTKKLERCYRLNKKNKQKYSSNTYISQFVITLCVVSLVSSLNSQYTCIISAQKLKKTTITDIYYIDIE